MTTGGCPYIPTKDLWFRATYNGKTTKWAKICEEYPRKAVMRQLESFGFDLFAVLAKQQKISVKSFKKFVDTLDAGTVDHLEWDFVLKCIDAIRCPWHSPFKNGDFGVTWELDYRVFAYVPDHDKDFSYGHLDFEGDGDDWVDEDDE